MLAVSRGALLAVAIGTALWLIVVPLRMRAAVLIGGVLVTTLPLVAWAFAQDGITGDNARMALRTDAGQGFGALLLLLFVALSVAGPRRRLHLRRQAAGRAHAWPARRACSSARSRSSPRSRS